MKSYTMYMSLTSYTEHDASQDLPMLLHVSVSFYCRIVFYCMGSLANWFSLHLLMNIWNSATWKDSSFSGSL